MRLQADRRRRGRGQRLVGRAIIRVARQDAPEIYRVGPSWLAWARATGNKTVVIDLAQADRLDFTGLGVFLWFLRKNRMQPVLVGAPARLIYSLRAMQMLDGAIVEEPARRRSAPRREALDLGPQADRADNRSLLHRVAAGELHWSPATEGTASHRLRVHASGGKPLSPWDTILLNQALGRDWIRLDYTMTLTDLGRAVLVHLDSEEAA
jgi:ABC-type transporter Mla MlaB component